MKSNRHKIFLGCLAIFLSGMVQAQKDTTGKGGIDIISSFKPVLRNTAKINFNASPPPADTSKPRLNYDIPNQNLLFGYQPGSLKPLAMNIDSFGKFNKLLCKSRIWKFADSVCPIGDLVRRWT